MKTVTIYQGDLDALREEGWTVGASWSRPHRGESGYYLFGSGGERLEARVTPCSEDSLAEELTDADIEDEITLTDVIRRRAAEENGEEVR